MSDNRELCSEKPQAKQGAPLFTKFWLAIKLARGKRHLVL